MLTNGICKGEEVVLAVKDWIEKFLLYAHDISFHTLQDSVNYYRGIWGALPQLIYESSRKQVTP